MFPLQQIEFSQFENYKQTTENLEERLIYDGYPELTHHKSWYEKKDYLKEIVNSYLLKDILIFDGIKNSDKIYDLLRLIAFQVGKEVALQELGNQLNMSKNTVERYLDLLSKCSLYLKLKVFREIFIKKLQNLLVGIFTITELEMLLLTILIPYKTEQMLVIYGKII